MSDGVEAYEIAAKYYDDAYTAKKDLVDLPFYLDLAKRIGGPILELACGTGRLLLPIAREGIARRGPISVKARDGAGAVIGHPHLRAHHDQAFGVGQAVARERPAR